MAIPTPTTTKLELVQGRRGNLKLMYDGAYVPGVMKIDISQKGGERPVINVQFFAGAVRFSTIPVIEEADGGQEAIGG